jgi:hypothetical protein
MEVCISMAHDELEDFATPVIRTIVVDDDVYDNDKYNNEKESEMDDETDESVMMSYNYNNEYFY